MPITHDLSRSNSDGCQSIPAHLLYNDGEPHGNSETRPRSFSSDANLPSAPGCVAQSGADHSVRVGQQFIETPPRVNSSIDDSLRLQTIKSSTSFTEPTEPLPPLMYPHSPLPLFPSLVRHSQKFPYHYPSRNSSPPPLHPLHRKTLNHNSLGGAHYPQQHRPQQTQQCLSPPNDAKIESVDSIDNNSLLSRLSNSTSIHSVESPRQGYPLHSFTQNHQRRYSNISTDTTDNDSDSAVDSTVDSIVFKYKQGKEVPPAEYALPASILKVYGVDCECFHEEMIRAGIIQEKDMSAKQFYTQECCEGHNQQEIRKNDDSSGHQTRSLNESQMHKSGVDSLHDVNHHYESPNARSHQILPYNERKKLKEIEEKKSQVSANFKAKYKGVDMRRGKEIAYKGTGKIDKISVLSRSNDDTGTNGIDEDEKSSGWFGQLTSLIKPLNAKSQQRYGSMEEESESYRVRAQAFLEKTQKQRNILKERTKADECNNMDIYGNRQGLHSGHKAKVSSTLDSIVSCSDDDDDDETNSSGDETESSNNDEESPFTIDGSNNHKVWSYGEPPIRLTPRKIVLSKHDKRMEQERLLQEEYEFQLQKITDQNEQYVKNFRVLVLVVVAFVLLAALAFAFVLCIKMLLSPTVS